MIVDPDRLQRGRICRMADMAGCHSSGLPCGMIEMNRVLGTGRIRSIIVSKRDCVCLGKETFFAKRSEMTKRLVRKGRHDSLGNIYAGCQLYALFSTVVADLKLLYKIMLIDPNCDPCAVFPWTLITRKGAGHRVKTEPTVFATALSMSRADWLLSYSVEVSS